MLVAKPVLFLALFIGGILTTAAIGILTFGLLASLGGPDEAAGVCRNSEPDLEDPVSPGIRDAVTDPALAAQWQSRWETFLAQAAAGQAVSVTFEESEVTSRASRWIAEENIPLRRVTVCFYDGEAEARASAEVPWASDIPFLGGAFDTDVAVRGRIDLSQQHPRIDVRDIDAGMLPNFATGRVEDDLESLINDRLAEMTLPYPMEVVFRETQAEVVAGR